MLIETRAKGGNLLLNVGPKPDGELPIEQEERLREIALWNFVNGESIAGGAPLGRHQRGQRLVHGRRARTPVYAFITRTSWVLGERKTFTLRSVRATGRHDPERPGARRRGPRVPPRRGPAPDVASGRRGAPPLAHDGAAALHRPEVVRPVVLKLTHVQPGLTPPVVAAGAPSWSASGSAVTLRGGDQGSRRSERGRRGLPAPAPQGCRGALHSQSCPGSIRPS